MLARPVYQAALAAFPGRPLALAVAAVFVVACGRSTPEESTAPPPAADAAWPVSVQPSAPAFGARAGEPQLTASPAGVILSWLEHGDRGATLRFSERTDAGWSEPRTVTSGDNWFISWADVPSVLRMTDGTLVATWYPATDASIEAYDLRLAYSRDNGSTWSAPFAPHHDGTTTQHGFASLFELPGRQLGLVWLDGREQQRKSGEPEGGAMGLFYGTFDTTAADRRGAWKQTSETAVNARVCECCQTTAVVTADGVVAAFRDRSPREIRDINVTRLENNAWTDARPLHVDNWRIEACPVNGPALSARGRAVAAAWFTAANDQPRAWAAFSADAGRTWGEPIRLDDASTLGHVDIEMLEDGSAVATWAEFAEQRTRLHMRRVQPNGTRSAAVAVTDARVTGYPRLARRGSELVVAWTESEGEQPLGEQLKAAVVTLK